MSTSSYFLADHTFSSNYAPSDSSSSFVCVEGTTMCVSQERTPASSSATGIKGEMCWDSTYLYICTATNTWKRISLSSF